MVQRHVGNHRNHRRNDVSGIPQAAHTDFNNGIIHLLQIKIQKSRRRQHLKLRRLLANALFDHAFRSHAHCADKHSKIIIADIPAVKIDALVVFHQMWRSEFAHLQISGQQNISNHTGYGTLAIRAGNMHRFDFLLRIIQLPQQSFDALHAQLDAELAQPLQIRQTFSIIHNILHNTGKPPPQGRLNFYSVAR